jgi:hypothetical protein
MFESKDEVKEAVDLLMKLAGRYERGQCIDWHEIEAITGPRYEGRAPYVIRKWLRRMERDREIVTLAAIGAGVRLLTHLETSIEIPAIRQKKAYRQIRRGLRQTDTVDQTRLTGPQRKLLVSQRNNMVLQRRELHRSRKQLATGRITEVKPRRAIPA